MPNLSLLPQHLQHVATDETVVRYVHHKHIQADGSLTSMAFLDKRGVSVDRRVLLAPGTPPKSQQPPHVGYVEFGVSECPEGVVVPDPIPDNLAHAVVVAVRGTRSAQDRLAKALKSLVEEHWDPRAALRQKGRLGL
jgi:hypothetical protein